MNVQNTKILYIDDDADDRQFLAEAIKMVNPTVEVVCAENGIKGLDYLNTVKKTDAELPSLIVLDINMPYLDGKETFHTIRKDPELGTIPIVVFNSSENPNDKRAFNNEGVEFINKPFNITYMTHIVSDMLGKCNKQLA